MNIEKRLIRMLATVLVLSAVTHTSATTLIRASLDDLTVANNMIVLGEVIELYSYWNSDGTFILTDVRVLTRESLKGKTPVDGEFTFTLMGGTVGELTALIVGGPELVPGRQYVLFLNEEDLPSTKATLTVRDHSQGVFDVVQVDNRLRAVSQASRHPLLPDVRGEPRAPGGTEGILLDDLRRSVRQLVEPLDIVDPENVQ